MEHGCATVELDRVQLVKQVAWATVADLIDDLASLVSYVCLRVCVCVCVRRACHCLRSCAAQTLSFFSLGSSLVSALPIPYLARRLCTGSGTTKGSFSCFPVVNSNW